MPTDSINNRTVDKPSAAAGWLRLLLFVVLTTALFGGSVVLYLRPAYVASTSAAEYEVAAKEQQWTVALTAAEQWAASSPDAADAWLAVAEAARRLGQYSRTAEALGSIPDRDPKALNALALRGDLLLSELRRPTAAIENWQRMLRTTPAADLPHQRLIYVYAMTLQRTKLQEQIRLAVDLECESPEMYVYLMLLPSLQFSDGLIKTTDWLRGEPDNRDVKIAQAVYAARSDASSTLSLFETAGAVPGDQTLLEQLLKDYSGAPELLSVKIDQAMHDDDVVLAEQLLSQADSDADADSRFWRYRGWVALSRRNMEFAIQLSQRALVVNPLDWKARHQLAEAQRITGDNLSSGKNSEIAARGKVLERTFLELPRANQITTALLVDLQKYVADCGDTDVAEALSRRLAPVSWE